MQWFRRLIPGLFPDSKGFDEEQERRGFNLAVTTEETLLSRIQGIIARVLGTGSSVRAAPKLIDQVLDDAGVTPKNPQYAEMVFRTNTLAAYNRGSHEEMQSPDVADSFPVWRYVGIRDGRQGKDHEPRFDRYYPNHVSFEEVRGPRAFNCRCTTIPVYKTTWKKLQERGAAVSKYSERFCDPGTPEAKPGPCAGEGGSANTPKTPREQHAAAVAAIDAEHAKKLEQHAAVVKTHEEAVAAIDAKHAEAYGAWEKRKESREAREERIDNVASFVPGVDAEGDEAFEDAQQHSNELFPDFTDKSEEWQQTADAITTHAAGFVSDWQAACGPEGVLMGQLRGAGFGEQDTAKLSAISEKALPAINKAAERVGKAAEAKVKIERAFQELGGVEPEAPDDLPETGVTPEMQAAHDKAQTKYEKISDKWSKLEDKQWDVDSKVAETQSDLQEVYDSHLEKIGKEVLKLQEQGHEVIDKEAEDDEEPEDNTSDEYPDEPEEPDEPEYPDEPEEEEPEEEEPEEPEEEEPEEEEPEEPEEPDDDEDDSDEPTEPVKHGERFADSDIHLYAELTRFCQSGPNKGKPGVCPEHQDRKKGVLARTGKAGKTVRVGKVMEHRVVAAITKRVPATLRKAALIAVKVAFSSWLPAQAAARAVAQEIAKSSVHGTAHEIGGARHAKKVGRLLIAADLAAAKTIAPAIGALAGPAAGGVAYMMPLASTAYLAYAAVRHPQATIAAAKNAIAGVKKKLGKAKPAKHAEEERWPKPAIAALFKGFAKAGDRSDWYEALVHVALDETKGDLGVAVQLADAALAEHADKPAARFAETCDKPDGLLEVPDVPQIHGYECGAAAAFSVGSYFGVGPANLDAWKEALATDPENGTPPDAIIRVLSGLGLEVEARQCMTLGDLRDCWERGQPVLCPIQDYDPDAGSGGWDGGHWVIVVGVDHGYVFVQDSMADVELEGSSSDAAPGKVMITEKRFAEVWHDRSADGRIYLHFGIIVSR